MLLETSFDWKDEAKAIYDAVKKCMNEGFVTKDINPEKDSILSCSSLGSSPKALYNCSRSRRIIFWNDHFIWIHTAFLGLGDGLT
jgi:hypothetical protein